MFFSDFGGCFLRLFVWFQNMYLLESLQTLAIDISNAWVKYSPGDTHDHMIPVFKNRNLFESTAECEISLESRAASRQLKKLIHFLL